MTIRPAANQILVKPMPESQIRSAGGLVVDEVKTSPNLSTGEVVLVGDMCSGYVEGEYLVFENLLEIGVIVEGRPYKLVKPENVVARLVKE